MFERIGGHLLSGVSWQVSRMSLHCRKATVELQLEKGLGLERDALRMMVLSQTLIHNPKVLEEFIAEKPENFSTWFRKNFPEDGV